MCNIINRRHVRSRMKYTRELKESMDIGFVQKIGDIGEQNASISYILMSNNLAM